MKHIKKFERRKQIVVFEEIMDLVYILNDENISYLIRGYFHKSMVNGQMLGRIGIDLYENRFKSSLSHGEGAINKFADDFNYFRITFDQSNSNFNDSLWEFCDRLCDLEEELNIRVEKPIPFAYNKDIYIYLNN